MIALFVLAALAYGAASYGYGSDPIVAAEARVGPDPRAVARPLLALAAALHVGLIGAQCLRGAHPFASVFLAVGFGALLAVAGYLALSFGRRLERLGALIAPFGLLGMALSVVFTDPGEAVELTPALVGRAHIALATAGIGGFALASGVAASYLAFERRLRRKDFRPAARGGGMSLTGLDQLHHRLVLMVTPVFTLAIITGVLWTLREGGPGALEGRVFELLAGGLAWLASVGLLVARAVWGTRGRTSAWLTLAAFVAIVLVVISYGVRG
jgi:ABC-type uncharacterized transport system permease subunit